VNRTEERFYQVAAQEVAEKRFSQGIMAKALVESRGDEKETILSYIRLRVQQLADEETKRLRREQVIACMRASEAKRAALGNWWRSTISSSRAGNIALFTVFLPFGVLAAIVAGMKAIKIFVFNSGWSGAAHIPSNKQVERTC
jgi:CHASE3 domain sensor protein